MPAEHHSSTPDSFFAALNAGLNLKKYKTSLDEIDDMQLEEAVARLSAPEARDTQVGGSHYKDKTIQPWDAMEAWMSREGFACFLQGNVIKYLARYRDKDGVRDLKKAQHYLAKLIEVEEKE